MTDFIEQPAYLSPLTDAEHAQLGRIAILWGQIDWLLDELIVTALKLTREQQNAVIADKMIGAKLALLKPRLDGIEDERARASAEKFAKLVAETKTDRNRIFHGVWGWRFLVRQRRIERCVRHPKGLESPFKASHLPDLEKRLCEAATHGITAVVIIDGRKPSPGLKRFIHGLTDDLPEWVQEWSDRNAVRLDGIEDAWKPGELVRLKKPPE